MDKASFIPKPSFSKDNVLESPYRPVGMGIVLKFSIFLLILSLAGLGASFAYKKIVIKQIDTLAISLERAKTAFDIAGISEIEKLSHDTSDVKELVLAHRFPSRIFDLLEALTLPEITFSRFSYGYKPVVDPIKIQQNTPAEIRVTLSGEAKNYTIIAQQGEVFAKNEKISEYSFSGFSLNDNGVVSFLLTIIFDPLINQ